MLFVSRDERARSLIWYWESNNDGYLSSTSSPDSWIVLAVSSDSVCWGLRCISISLSSYLHITSSDSHYMSDCWLPENHLSWKACCVMITSCLKPWHHCILYIYIYFFPVLICLKMSHKMFLMWWNFIKMHNRWTIFVASTMNYSIKPCFVSAESQCNAPYRKCFCNHKLG